MLHHLVYTRDLFPLNMKNALEEPIDNPKQQPEVCQDPKRGELFFHLLFLLNTVWENSI